MFETETMAELCVGQGLLDQAIAIYRRLVAEAPDEITGSRRRRRLVELERKTANAPEKAPAPDKAPAPAAKLAPPAPTASELPVPGIQTSWDRRHTIVKWRLPEGTDAPALELLLVMKTAAGIITERRTLRLDSCEGRMALPVPDLHSVRAAAGRMEGDRFVPMARVDSDPRR
ncbi:MAG TPA: hypothetical protein VFH73_23465 [Polyangia bacterium]|jgi:hypothetical protein|nr:hypothetical protein [Polyangia bacterium]